MRPNGALPRLTRRSRRLVAAAMVIVVLLLIGPRLVDTYINWLWFGELGFRGVFTTALLTRITLFLIVGTIVGAVVFAGFGLAYRARPVFVPAKGPGDALAQYRALILSRVRLFVVGVPVLIGVLAGIIAQSYWMPVQLFLEGGDFGIKDPQFGLDLGFFAFDLPFYRFVLQYLFIAVFVALFVNALVHYIFGGIRLSGRSGTLSRPARIQLVTLVGILVVLKAAAYWLDRYELLSHTRTGKPFTGAGYTDINAVLPAKLILLAIAVICAVAVFSALVLKDLRIPAIGLALLLLSSLVVGAGWPLIVEQFSVKPNAAQKESEYIARSIKATRDAYGLTDDVVTYKPYSGMDPVTANDVRSDQATTSNIRLLDPNIVGRAFKQLQQGRNFYNFPEQLSIDRYKDSTGNLRDFVVAARELDPSALQDNQQDWINRHTVYTHGDGFVAAPANTTRGVADDPGANGGYPDFQVSAVGAPPQGPAPLDQPRVYFGPIIASAPKDYAIVGPGDQEYDTESKKYSYTGTGGVRVGGFVARTVFGLKYAERNFLFSNVIGDNSRILFNRDPVERVEAVAPWLTTDSKVYPAIVDRRMVWVVDGYTTLDNYPYSQQMSLSDATIDANVVKAKGALLDKQVSYIRNSVKATVDAYDGTVTLYQFDEKDPVLKAWMKVFPGSVKPKSDISADLANHLRYPEDLFKVQRRLLASYHVDDPVKFFNTSEFWEVPADPNEDPQTMPPPQPPYYIIAKDPGGNSDSPSFQLTSPLDRFRRDNVLAAFVSASSDPATYGKLTVLTMQGEAGSPRVARNAMDTDTRLSEELGRIRGQNNVELGNLLTLPIGNGAIMYVQPIYASPKAATSSAYPRLIRVVMNYKTATETKVAYAPKVQGALDGLAGGGGSVATAPKPVAGQVPPQGTQPTPTQGAQVPPPPVVAGTPEQLSTAKAAALQEVQRAIVEVKDAQKSGDFARYGQALKGLDDAMTKFTQAK